MGILRISLLELKAIILPRTNILGTRAHGKLLAHIECDSRGEEMKIEEKLKKMKNPSRALNWLKKNGSAM